MSAAIVLLLVLSNETDVNYFENGENSFNTLNMLQTDTTLKSQRNMDPIHISSSNDNVENQGESGTVNPRNGQISTVSQMSTVKCQYKKVNNFAAKSSVSHEEPKTKGTEILNDHKAQIIRKDTNAPFVAALYQMIHNKVTMTCDGTIISNQWVITAAHCVDVMGSVLGLPQAFYTGKTFAAIGVIKVIVGASNPSRNGYTYLTKQIIMHPKWNLTTQSHNIALIKMCKKINFIPGRVEAIHILKNQIDIQRTVQSYGWFGLTQNGDGPPKLQTFLAEILNEKECQMSIGLGVKLGSATSIEETSSQICLLPLPGERCSSNSGGPIVGNRKLIGIGEFDECDDEHTLMGVKVTYYVKWIMQTMETY